jgi:hypothetical protein
VRPDGSELRWKQIGVLDTMDDPVLPFYVQWESPQTEHPSARGGAVSIAGLVMSGDPETLSSLPEPLGDLVHIQWVDEEIPGITTVLFDTPHGRVSID